MAWCDVDLPLELQSWVLRNLGRDDLRRCRLVDKTTSVLSTPILFSTVHISPSMNSFRRLSKIAERPELARHVQHLECHNWGLADWFLDATMHQRVVEENIKVLSPGQSTDFDHQRLLARLYSGYLEEIAAQRELKGGEIVSRLQQLLKAFVQLRNVVWHECHGEDGDAMNDVRLPLEHELFRRTGVRNLSYRSTLGSYQSTLGFLQVCLGIGPSMPTSFAARGVRWSEFNSPLAGKSGLGQFLHRVLKLDWGFSLGELSEETVQDGAQGVFEKVLGGALMVQEMCLGFDFLPMFNLFEPHRRVCSSFLRGHHPVLRHLTLHDVAVPEDDLINFVRIHRASLESLTLSEMELPEMERRDGWTTRPSSVVRTIWRLRQEGELKRMCLRGCLTDRWSQAWVASESGKSSCMRSRIEAYICHRGEFPFPGLKGLGEEKMAVALRNGLEAERRRTKRIARWHEGLEEVGDESWCFEGRLLS
jgi:hypothetical protein